MQNSQFIEELKALKEAAQSGPISIGTTINIYSHLLDLIALMTEHEKSIEAKELANDKEALKAIEYLVKDVLEKQAHKASKKIEYSTSIPVLQFLKTESEALKNSINFLFKNSLQELIKIQNSHTSADETSIPTHPITVYSQILGTLLELTLDGSDDAMLEDYADAVDHICQQLYDVINRIEQSLNNKQLSKPVDAVWTLALLGKNKDAIMYTLGAWRLAKMFIELEKLGAPVMSGQEDLLQNANEQDMKKLLEALAEGTHFDVDEDEESEDDDDECEEEEDDDDESSDSHSRRCRGCKNN